MTDELLTALTNDLERSRRRLIREVNRVDALEDLLGRVIELTDRHDRPPTLADLEADAKAKGAVELARYQGLIETLKATGDE